MFGRNSKVRQTAREDGMHRAGCWTIKAVFRQFATLDNPYGEDLCVEEETVLVDKTSKEAFDEFVSMCGKAPTIFSDACGGFATLSDDADFRSGCGIVVTEMEVPAEGDLMYDERGRVVNRAVYMWDRRNEWERKIERLVAKGAQ